MPISMQQHDNGRILHYIYTDTWGMRDLEALRPQEKKLFDQATHKIHVLVDAHAIRSAPPGIFKERKHVIVTHPNSGFIAVVGAPALIQVLSHQLFKLAHYERVRFFSVAEEPQAWDYLRSLDVGETTKAEPVKQV